MHALALVLALAAPTAPPADAPLLHPAFSIALMKGEVTKKGTDAEGMAKVAQPEASQLVYWNAASRSLEARAEHERGLVVRAGKEEGVEATVSPLEARPGLGRGAFAWRAKLDRTTFESAVVDCGSHHVLLTM